MFSDGLISQPIMVILSFAFLTLIPFFFVTVTSFIKFTAVFSIMRSALGTPQIPPNIVVTSLALILTGIIMMPVGMEIQLRFEQNGMHWQDILEFQVNNESIGVFWDCFKDPVSAFLIRHVHEKEWMMIAEIASKFRGCELDRENFFILAAAFILSELKEAFQIGFLIFLPFIVIDMIVANILQSLGMVMLSPSTISLPFKLLLFVLADGWYLVVEGLLSGYL
ncbi:MAG: flagellar type III secretion system pore protein FliP [bacterium]